MRHVRFAVTVLASTAVVALPADGASTSPAASLTIRVVSTSTGERMVDTAPKGVLNKGDAIYTTSVLRNALPQFGKPKGALVGSDAATFTLRTPSTALVDARVRLPGATLHVRGVVEFDVTGSVPVVGGSGRFTKARGTCLVEELGDGRSRNTYRLRVP